MTTLVTERLKQLAGAYAFKNKYSASAISAIADEKINEIMSEIRNCVPARLLSEIAFSVKDITCMDMAQKIAEDMINFENTGRKKYKIVLSETVNKEIEVLARSGEEAMLIVRQGYLEGNIKFSDKENRQAAYHACL